MYDLTSGIPLSPCHLSAVRSAVAQERALIISILVFNIRDCFLLSQSCSCHTPLQFQLERSLRVTDWGNLICQKPSHGEVVLCLQPIIKEHSLAQRFTLAKFSAVFFVTGSNLF